MSDEDWSLFYLEPASVSDSSSSPLLPLVTTVSFIPAVAPPLIKPLRSPLRARNVHRVDASAMHPVVRLEVFPLRCFVLPRQRIFERSQASSLGEVAAQIALW